MNIIDKQIVKRFHTLRLQEAAANPAQAQGWTNRDEQAARFQAFLELADFNNVSVLDLGCGYGDFKARLDEDYQSFEYIGLDQQPEFIAYARQRYKDQPKTWFHEVDFSTCQLPETDIVVASGVLSYKSANPDYYWNMIQRFYKVAKKTLLFNMLDQSSFDSGPLLVAHDKTLRYEQCLTICPNTVLKTGYLKNDFTIKMTKK